MYYLASLSLTVGVYKMGVIIYNSHVSPATISSITSNTYRHVLNKNSIKSVRFSSLEPIKVNELFEGGGFRFQLCKDAFFVRINSEMGREGSVSKHFRNHLSAQRAGSRVTVVGHSASAEGESE